MLFNVIFRYWIIDFYFDLQQQWNSTTFAVLISAHTRKKKNMKNWKFLSFIYSSAVSESDDQPWNISKIISHLQNQNLPSAEPSSGQLSIELENQTWLELERAFLWCILCFGSNYDSRKKIFALQKTLNRENERIIRLWNAQTQNAHGVSTVRSLDTIFHSTPPNNFHFIFSIIRASTKTANRRGRQHLIYDIRQPN